jgi:hypothetical protein
MKDILAKPGSPKREGYDEPGERRLLSVLDMHLRVEQDFIYHAPTPGMIPVFAGLRSHARDLAHHIIDSTPPGRELELSLQALEESIFWANAGIARQAPQGRQEPDARQNLPPFAR